jgi:hypothetical protein
VERKAMKSHTINTSKIVSKLLLEKLKAAGVFVEIHPSLFSECPDIVVQVKSKKAAQEIDREVVDLQQYKLF